VCLLLNFNQLTKQVEKHSRINIIEDDKVSILLTETGGRILSVDFGYGNLLWVNPDFEKILEIKDWNIGGIRSWFAPEQLFFYLSPNDFTNWFCQKEIDPANYRFEKNSSQKSILKTSLNFINMGSKSRITGKFTKKIELIDCKKNDDEFQCSIEIQNKLQLEDCDTNINTWTLIQVPTNDLNPGLVSIPIKDDSKPIHYFTPIPDDYLKVESNETHFLMDGKKELKLGIKPEDVKDLNNDLFSYSYSLNQKKAKITLKSSPIAQNQNQCVDTAKFNPQGPKGVLQFYNSDYTKSNLRFGELEIHSKPFIKGSNQKIAKDELIISFQMKK